MIERVTPGRLLTGALLVWLFLFLVAPIEVAYWGTGIGFVLLLANLGALSLGLWLPMSAPLGQRFSLRPLDVRQCYYALLALGLVGVVGRLYDWFVLRNVDLEADEVAGRAAVAQAGSSLVSVVAAGLLPFGMAALLMFFLARARGERLPYGALAFLLALAPSLLGLLLASRSGLMLTALLLALAFVCTARTVRLSHLALIAVAGLALFAFLGTVFLSRLEASSSSFLLTSRVSGYTYLVPLQPWVQELLLTLPDALGRALFSLTSYLQYALHGVFEFQYLVDKRTGDPFYGTFHLFFLEKLLAVVGLATPAASPLLAMPRVGIYTTFFGPVFVDVGWASPLLCLFWGLQIGFARRSVLRGNLLAFPLYILLLAQLALTPFVSGVMGASIFANLGFLGLWAFSAVLPGLVSGPAAAPRRRFGPAQRPAQRHDQPLAPA